MYKNVFQSLGPGLLFAGAAIGVSHLVQSTKAGGLYGMGLIWALVLIHIVKYPFFQFGPRFTAATGKTLLEGYKKVGKFSLYCYLIINLVNMFTIQAAVTIVTAGILSSIFPNFLALSNWAGILSIVGALILITGKYKALDRIIKYVIILLSVTTIIALALALEGNNHMLSFEQIIPTDLIGITFLISFLGWMPAPLDISIWHSLWAKEHNKVKINEAVFDFNVGYLGTLFLGLCFLLLGALIMYHSGMNFSNSAASFATQFIELYTNSIGNWAFYIIGIAAFATMFSTTLTTLDASPRVMDSLFSLLFEFKSKYLYLAVLIILVIGTQVLIVYAESSMLFLIKTATVLSFLTAPFFAIMNLYLMKSKQIPREFRPGTLMTVYSLIGIIFLTSFCIYYLYFLNQY